MRSDDAQLALGQQMRYLRKVDGMSQAEAAWRISVNATHLNNVEKGRDPANGKIVAVYENSSMATARHGACISAVLTESPAATTNTDGPAA